MPISTRFFRAGLAAVAAASLMCFAEAQNRTQVIWVDFDMQDIPEPKERTSSMFDDLVNNQMLEQSKQALDLARAIRLATGRKKSAANVNALDEVPDSSWYTNRHHLRKMSVDELARGPDRGEGPDFSHALITSAKTGGVTPGLRLTDAKGDSYLVKFDSVDYPELQSGAEVIATKILYAAGYSVPENYVGFIDAGRLVIGKNVEVFDRISRRNLPFTRADLDEMLRRAARMPDGRYRVMASKIIAGKPKGPFPQIGLRRDDPNDLIPHEHRRELRGLRVIASWINHWDMKEQNSLDVYVEENGRKFLRHYLIDFGSALGGGRDPQEYFRSREHIVDIGSMMRELFTLGVYRSADEKRGIMISPAVGMFTADDFDPEKWRPAYPVMAFDNITAADAFWAVRIILSFSESDLRSIVGSGRYSVAGDSDYILQTLLKRRTIVARHWLAKTNGLSNFSIQPSSNGITLRFRDLLIENQAADLAATEYTFQVRGPCANSDRQVTAFPAIYLSGEALAAAAECGSAGDPVEVSIWPKRGQELSKPVRISFDRASTRIKRITRG